jgi:CO/xanthine dehydrogenase FAD-binding subunit
VKRSEDRPFVVVFTRCWLSGPGRHTDIAVCVGGARETRQRLPDVEATPSGLGQDVRAAIADGDAERSETLDDVRRSAWYRTELVRVWVRRALESTRLRAANARGAVA